MPYPFITVPLDIQVLGQLIPASLTAPAGCITNANIAAGAGIEATKLIHDVRKCYAQESATTAASESRVIHTAIAAAGGTINAFKAGSVVVNVGAATIVVDLKKNGSSILTAPITLDSTNTVRVVEAAAIATPAYAVGDVFEVVITATAGGGTLGKGVFAEASFLEASQ